MLQSTTVYKLNNTDKVSWWTIEPLSDGSGFRTKWGIDHRCQSAGLNETVNQEPSPRCLEDRMQSEIQKKIAREGYSLEIPTEKPELPMLAFNYQDHIEKVQSWQYLCVQPKLDGHRCIATPGRQYTRRNTPYTSAPHIALIFNELVGDPIFGNIKVDGEFYLPGTDIETTQSAIRRAGPHPFYWRLIELHIFDVVAPELDFLARRALLGDIYSRLIDAWEDTTARKHTHGMQQYVMDTCPIKLVPTWDAMPEDLPAYHKEYVGYGYEGLMIRNPHGMYKVSGRSHDLLKYKDRLDTEFEIIDVIEKKNFQGVYKCRAANGDTFEVTPAASASFKRRIVQYRQNYIGKWVTVKYEKLSREGVPLKPTAHELHDGPKHG